MDRIPPARLGSLVGGLLIAALVPAAAGEPPPMVVAFVLDTSGSVGPKGVAVARGLASGLLSRLPAGSQAAVFCFDDQARLVLPRTSDAASIERALTSLKAQGSHTALYDALYDAGRFLREPPGGGRFIVLVTDGKDEDSSLELVDGLRMAEQQGIPVFALGVGKVEERVLRRIARLTGGEYLPAGQATAEGLAARMMERAAAAAPPQGESPGGPARPAAAAPAAGGAVGTARPAATPPAAADAHAGRERSLGWLWLLLGLVATAAAVTVFVMRRGRSARCPQCGRPRTDTLSPCAFCAAEERGSGGRPGPVDRALAADLSPTVMARLSSTEEYLENTITLRERPVLVGNRGASAGKVFDLNLESATCLGRAKANDIVLDDVAVSSEHCRIRVEDGGFVVHDLNSTNGTFVNDHKVSRQALAAGDVLQVGETFLQFRLEHRRE